LREIAISKFAVVLASENVVSESGIDLGIEIAQVSLIPIT
jgi:hypothetical protein